VAVSGIPLDRTRSRLSDGPLAAWRDLSGSCAWKGTALAPWSWPACRTGRLDQRACMLGAPMVLRH